MPDMLDRAARLVDGIDTDLDVGFLKAPPAAADEVADGVSLTQAFSNVVSFSTADGLVLFDVSHQMSAPAVVSAVRAWSSDEINTAVYTHGHIDHVTGARAFIDDAASRGHRPITFVGHEAIPDRFERYDLTNGYNGHINKRQFRLPEPFFPSDFVRPQHTYAEHTDLDVGGTRFELHHARGETDDHTWAWVPDHRAVCVGDLFIWQFPNAGNPQKVQRFAWEWAVALREMAALRPELLLPAHGMAIGGADRVVSVLTNTAEALESLHEQTLELMNAGARLDDVIHTVRLPKHLADLPYLKPTYDEPEFVVRNIWRLYGGWYDGNPANLKPARDADLAREMAHLAGGASVLAARATALTADGDLRLACHLIEMAHLADPDDPTIQGIRAEVYEARRRTETSFMATGIYRAAALDSRDRLG
ncbi:MAG: alkyl sulfatase dimerization domain-containing protein [Ilumatobacteraceae bacterium]